MIPRPAVISFDLDDTLWPCECVIARAEEAVYAWLDTYYPRITARYDIDAMRAVRVQTAARRPELQADLTRLRHETLAEHAREAGYDPQLAEAAVEVFLAERHRVELYPEVGRVLDALSRDYQLVALTNGNADIGRVGIGDWFALSVSAAQAGAPKPDPAMFQHSCEVFGIRAGDLLHVGDDPLRDIHAARQFGARTFWINRVGGAWPGDLQRPHHEATSLEALTSLVAGEVL